MADRDIADAGVPQERQRLRKLAQAALNADVTVEQVNDILGGLGGVLGDMDSTISTLQGTAADLDNTLARFSLTLDTVDVAIAQMGDVVDRMDAIVTRVELIVGIAEAAFRPIGVLESAGRSVAARLGIR